MGVARDTKQASNPAIAVEPDRPETLWVQSSPKYHRCDSASGQVLGVGVTEVGRKQRIAVHDHDGSLRVIERNACLAKTATGPQQGLFTGKSKFDTGWACRFQGAFHLFGLRMCVGDNTVDTAPSQMLHRKRCERPVRDRDDGFGPKVGQRSEARSEPGC
jgi:hypothetical protein